VRNVRLSRLTPCGLYGEQAPWRAGDGGVETTVYLSILCVSGCSKRSSGEAAADGNTAGVASGLR
jgi:hypothetical protein